MNYYPFHLGDYAAHTAHLEPMEDLAYRRMLDAYYLREAPLPSDPAEVARIIRMRQSLDEVEAVLREFFVLSDNGWQHSRCDEEIGRMQDKQAKARASAAASVNARRAKVQLPSNERTADVERTLSDRSTDVELPTPTPTPSYSVTNVTGGEPPIDEPPDGMRELSDKDKIFAYGVPILTGAGHTDKAARSFLAGKCRDHGEKAVVQAIRSCYREQPIDPLSWIGKKLPMKGSSHKGFEKVNYNEGINDDGSFN